MVVSNMLSQIHKTGSVFCKISQKLCSLGLVYSNFREMTNIAISACFAAVRTQPVLLELVREIHTTVRCKLAVSLQMLQRRAQTTHM